MVDGSVPEFLPDLLRTRTIIKDPRRPLPHPSLLLPRRRRRYCHRHHLAQLEQAG